MNAPRPEDDEIARRRKGAVRTALIVTGIAVAIYVAFILSGVIGR